MYCSLISWNEMHNLSNFFDFKLFSKAYKKVKTNEKYGVGPSIYQNEVWDIPYFVLLNLYWKGKYVRHTVLYLFWIYAITKKTESHDFMQPFHFLCNKKLLGEGNFNKKYSNTGRKIISLIENS